MTTGTIIMIVCAVLYGLLVIIHKLLFKEDDIVVKDDESEHFSYGLCTGADGVEGSAPGLFNDDLDIV